MTLPAIQIDDELRAATGADRRSVDGATGKGPVAESGVAVVTPAAAPDHSAAPLNLAEVPDWARADAARREAIIRPCLDAPRKIRRGLIAQTAAAHQLNEKTLYRWLKLYSAQGLPGLIPKWGGTRGLFPSLSPDAQEFIQRQFLSPTQPSPTTIYERLQLYCSHQHRPCPAQNTVNRYLLTIPKPAAIYHREGEKAYRAQAEPKGVRDLNACGVGEWWCADHRVFDVFVRVGAGEGEVIVRPWLTAWFDLGSRTCVGWHVSLVPNSETIALALRAGILRFGLPAHLYRDNGKDFVCHYWGGKSRKERGARLSDAALTLLAPGVLSPLGIETHEAIPYQPWSKPIESWFGHTFPEWEKELPGWCGRNAQKKPEKLVGEVQRGELLTLHEFTHRVAEQIDLYHHREHGTLGATPMSKWLGVAREIPQARTLDLLLMRHKPVLVARQGIRLFNRHYWADELTLRVGHKVEIRYDPQEIGRLYVFEGGVFLCEAEHQAALKMGESLEDVKERIRRQRRARQAVAAYRDQKRVLLSDPDHLAKQIVEERRAKKVYVLKAEGLPGQTAPRLAPVPKLLAPFDQAAKQIEANAAARTAAAVPTSSDPTPTAPASPAARQAGPTSPRSRRPSARDAAHAARGPADLFTRADGAADHAHDEQSGSLLDTLGPRATRADRNAERLGLLEELCG